MSLSLFNYTSDLNFHALLRRALTCNFPFFETRCELSPQTICDHPHISCRHAKIALIGYALYQEGTYTFEPLHEEPQPIFDFVCNGCAETRQHCTEGCRSFLEELVGYRVYYWDHRTRRFEDKVIGKNEYDPLFHGYFSYRLWKEEQKEIEAKRREKRKQQKDRSTESAQHSRWSGTRETPLWIDTDYLEA